MEALEHEERQGIANRDQVGFDLRQPFGEAFVALITEAEVVGFGILPAVEGWERPSVGRLPEKDVGARVGRAAEVMVDRHAEALDARVEQQVGEGPVLPVNVAVHGVADVEPVVAAQALHGAQALDELVGVEQWRVVGLHRHHFEQPCFVRGDQAINVSAGRSFEPGVQPAGGLYRPAEAAIGRIAGVPVDQPQGVIDEAILHLPKDRLVVGEPHIGMGMVDDVDGIKRHGRPPSVGLFGRRL